MTHPDIQRCAEQAGLGDIPAEKLLQFVLRLKLPGLDNVPSAAYLHAHYCRAPQAADLRPLAISPGFEMLDWRQHPPPIGKQMICGSAGLGTSVLGHLQPGHPEKSNGAHLLEPLAALPIQPKARRAG